MLLTLVQVACFLFILYCVKLSKPSFYWHEDYRTIALLLVSKLVLYSVTLLKGASLFLPSLVFCLCIYFKICVEMALSLWVYPHSEKFLTLNLPFSSIFLVLLCLQGS